MSTKDYKPGPAKPPRVLVVEGNACYRSVISHVVELAGGQWESVSEIDPGRKLLAGNRKFDLVIIGLDPESPVDPAVLTEIRAIAPIIMLDETYNGSLQKFEAGAEQILPKPFVPDALVGAIRVEFRAAGPSSVVPLATKIELGGLVFDLKRRCHSERGRGSPVHQTRMGSPGISFGQSPVVFFGRGDPRPNVGNGRIDRAAEELRRPNAT